MTTVFYNPACSKCRRVREILESGASRARAIARETMAAVRERMGLDWRSAVR